MKHYKDLDVYRHAYDLAKQVHDMSMKLPDYELRENGSQVRQTSSSIKDYIAEGFSRRAYKDDFVRNLVYARAASEKVIAQLYLIEDLHFEKDELDELKTQFTILSKRIKNFTESAQNWEEDRES